MVTGVVGRTVAGLSTGVALRSVPVSERMSSIVADSPRSVRIAWRSETPRAGRQMRQRSPEPTT
jgi:hypothetical protein